MARDWRWHKLCRQWLRKDDPQSRVNADGNSNPSSQLPIVDLTNGAPLGTQPIRLSENVEKGVYVFFDARNWRRERRWLDLDYRELDSGRVTAMPNGVGVGGPVQGRVHTGDLQSVGSSGIANA
jgi:CCR4-NOT transcription complex subunit 2